MEIDLLAGPTTGTEGSLESAFQTCPQILSIVPSPVRLIHPLKDILTLLRLTKMFRSTREFLDPATPSAVPMAMTWCAGRWSVATRRITDVFLGDVEGNCRLILGIIWKWRQVKGNQVKWKKWAKRMLRPWKNGRTGSRPSLLSCVRARAGGLQRGSSVSNYSS
jgi:hypothetical protein